MFFEKDIKSGISIAYDDTITVTVTHYHMIFLVLLTSFLVLQAFVEDAH